MGESLLILGMLALTGLLALSKLKPSSLNNTVNLADSRVVNIILAVGDFEFLDLKIYRIDPETGLYESYVFPTGENVYFNGVVRNNGTGVSAVRLDVIDTETGNSLGWFSYPNIGPGEELELAGVGGAIRAGAMPNHDWDITFQLTP